MDTLRMNVSWGNNRTTKWFKRMDTVEVNNV